jgi:hypothetical protein
MCRSAVSIRARRCPPATRHELGRRRRIVNTRPVSRVSCRIYLRAITERMRPALIGTCILMLCTIEICKFEMVARVTPHHAPISKVDNREGEGYLQPMMEESFFTFRKCRVSIIYTSLVHQTLRIRGGEPQTPLPQTPNSAMKRSRRLLGQSPEYKSLSPTVTSARKKRSPIIPRKLVDSPQKKQQPTTLEVGPGNGKVVIPGKAFDRIQASLQKGKRASVRQGGRSRMGVVLQNGKPYTVDGRLVVKGDQDDSSSVDSDLSSGKSDPNVAQNAGLDGSHTIQQDFSGPTDPSTKRAKLPEIPMVKKAQSAVSENRTLHPKNVSSHGPAPTNSRKRQAFENPKNESGLANSSPIMSNKKAKRTMVETSNKTTHSPRRQSTPRLSPNSTYQTLKATGQRAAGGSGKPQGRTSPAVAKTRGKAGRTAPAPAGGQGDAADEGDAKRLEDVDGRASLTGKKDLLITGMTNLRP